MEHLTSLIKAAAFAFLLLTSISSKSQIIDQFDSTYNGGLSARTLPGYSWYQTFTAGITGNLTRIDIGFFNFISGSGTLEVFNDTGITGSLLFTSQVNIACAGNGCLLPFAVNCNVIAGNRYTFHFTPGIGIPDPFGVQIDFTNSYSGGEFYGIDPSGTYPYNMDVIFATYVKPETAGMEEEKPDANTFYRIVGRSVLLNENLKGEIFSVDSRKGKMTDLIPGIYLLRIFCLENNYVFKIYIK